MAQYIDKDASLSEIERWIELLTNEKNKEGLSQIDKLSLGSRIAELQEVKAFLDTLGTEKVDSEEKATQLSQKYFPDEENIWARSNIEAQKCKSACIEMVAWLKTQKGE